jgi:hypothetical protein
MWSVLRVVLTENNPIHHLYKESRRRCCLVEFVRYMNAEFILDFLSSIAIQMFFYRLKEGMGISLSLVKYNAGISSVGWQDADVVNNSSCEIPFRPPVLDLETQGRFPRRTVTTRVDSVVLSL